MIWEQVGPSFTLAHLVVHHLSGVRLTVQSQSRAIAIFSNSVVAVFGPHRVRFLLVPLQLLDSALPTQDLVPQLSSVGM